MNSHSPINQFQQLVNFVNYMSSATILFFWNILVQIPVIILLFVKTAICNSDIKDYLKFNSNVIMLPNKISNNYLTTINTWFFSSISIYNKVIINNLYYLIQFVFWSLWLYHKCIFTVVLFKWVYVFY